MDAIWLVRLSGLAAILGVLIYALGDVLLLASKADLKDFPALQAHAKLLSGAEKMVVLPCRRLAWGGLLGVFATPLVLAGFWQVHTGLAPAGWQAALPPFLLFAFASVVGAFVHGTFIYMGEYVQAFNRLEQDSQAVLVEMIGHHRKIMLITYAFLLGGILAATIWYAILVGGGNTRFPVWMAAVNPVTTLAAWMLTKKVLPARVRDSTEGAGFNIAYLAFFIFTTAILWQPV